MEVSVFRFINSQELRQIQNAIMAESGHVTQKGWNVPVERPEINTEVLRNGKARNISKSELVLKRLNDEPTDNTYDMVTGENESPINVPEFLTGRMSCNHQAITTNPMMTSIPYLTRRFPVRASQHQQI